ncbi:MAG: acylphosphatase, partial [Calditrichaceae bacterium]
MNQPNNKSSIQRKRITVNGIVQGVGFRPFIYKLATELQLTGFVSNSSSGVIIEIEGPKQILNSFINRLLIEAPPLSEISEIQTTKIKFQNTSSFIIQLSESDKDVQTLISPDVSICEDCHNELMDISDRRYHYPF